MNKASSIENTGFTSSAGPPSCIALQGGMIIDGTGREPVTVGTLLIRDGRIEGAGPASDIRIPEDADVYDVAGYSILPGLIDTHVHIDLHGEADTQQENLVEDKLRTLRAAWEMKNTLRAGFTTVRSAGSVNFIDIAVRQAIEAGFMSGPRLLTSGKIICMKSAGSEYFEGLYREADGADENRKAAREQLKQGADYLKIMATGAVMNPGGIPGAPQLDVDEMQAVVDEAAKIDTYVAAHAHGAEGIKNAIHAGVRTIEHGTLADDEALQMMVEHGVFLVSTLCSNYYMLKAGNDEAIPDFMYEKAQEISEMRLDMLRRARRAGVKIVLGTDAGTPFNYHGNNAMELVRYVKEGLMSELEAITAGTGTAAEAINLGSDTGTLEAGKTADILVLRENPLDDITALLDRRNIASTFKQGKFI